MAEFESYALSTADAVMVPDTLLPSQHVDMHKRTERTPEVRLVLAVMEDALTLIGKNRAGLIDWTCAGTVQDKIGRSARDAMDAYAWVASTDDRPWGFNWSCETLGWHPDNIRKRLASGENVLKGFKSHRRPVTRRVVGDMAHNVRGNNQYGSKGKPVELQVWP